MEKNILVYNNKTGIAEKMAPLFAGEGLSVLVAADIEHLYTILSSAQIHLMLVDVELNDKGWDRGIEMIANLRKKSSIRLSWSPPSPRRRLRSWRWKRERTIM